jgi:glycyl-tRNA synthetase
VSAAFPFILIKLTGGTWRLRFTDWMVKDLKTGEIFRADHLVEAVLESRLKGNQEARGQAAAPPAAEDDKKKKKKKVVKSTAIKLEDETVKDYEFLLAQVRNLLESVDC